MIPCGTSDFSKSQPERTPRDRGTWEKGEIFREKGSLESRKIPPNFNPSKSRVENRRRMGGGRVGRENFRRHKRDDGAVVVLFLQGHSPGGRARVNRSLDLVEA